MNRRPTRIVASGASRRARRCDPGRAAGSPRARPRPRSRVRVGDRAVGREPGALPMRRPTGGGWRARRGSSPAAAARRTDAELHPAAGRAPPPNRTTLPGHDVLVDQPAMELGLRRRNEIRPRLGLSPNSRRTTPGSDRATAIVGVGDRHQPRRDCARRAAARSARRCAPGRTGCGRRPGRRSVLGRMRARSSWSCHDHEPGALERRDRCSSGAVVAGAAQRQEPRGLQGRRRSSREILDQDRTRGTARRRIVRRRVAPRRRAA